MMKRFAVNALGAILLSAAGCVHAPATSAASAPPVSEKLVLRNNAASLLYDLLGDERNVSKILLIKFDRAELKQLIKAISKTTGSAADRLEKMAANDPGLNLRAIELPAGEKAARAAVARTKEHELLLSSGDEFEFSLLLTQAEALSYGRHLTKVAAENSSQPEQIKAFQSLDIALGDLYSQVVTLMRNPPKH